MVDEIAYRELKPGEVIQPGDEWQTDSGQWALFHQSMIGLTTGVRARRPYNITQMRERAVSVMCDLLTKSQHFKAELAQLQQSQPAADHIADASKMVESELERKAWELYLRRHVDQEDAFNKAERFIAERNRRRQIQRENDAIIADVVGDRS